MSQVRKFDTGGDTADLVQPQSSPKYGRIISNGKVYEITDDQLDQISSFASNADTQVKRYVYSDLLSTLRAGRDVSIQNGSVSGLDLSKIDSSIIDSLNKNAGYSNRSQRIANRNARRNNMNHQVAVAIDELARMNFASKPKTEDSSSTATSLIDLYGNPRSFEYTTNDDGTKTWVNGPQNAGNTQAIRNFFDALGLSDEEREKKYTVGNNSQNDWSNLKAWYSGNQNYNVDELISRAQNNTLTTDDWALLASMGFTKDGTTTGGTTQQQQQRPRVYEGSGFDSKWAEDNDYYIVKGDDGNSYLYQLGEDEEGNPRYNLVRDRRIYLRGMDWAKNSPFANGALINGRFYTDTDIFNGNTEAGQEFANLTRALYGAYGRDSWLAGRNTGWEFLNSNAPDFWYEEYNQSEYANPTWDSYFRGLKSGDNTWFVQNLNNAFSGIPEGMEIIAYLDPNSKDRDGFDQVKYAISHPNGTKSTFKSDAELKQYLQQQYNISPQDASYTGLGRFNKSTFETADGKRFIYLGDVQDPDGLNTTRLYMGPDGNYYYRGGSEENPMYTKIDPEKNPELVEQFRRGEFTARNDQLDKVIINNWWNRWFRKTKINTVKNKKGGTIIDPRKVAYVKRLQLGGYVPIVGEEKINKPDEDSKVTISDSHQAFGGKEKGVRTSADKKDKTAAILDAASLGLMFVPGVGWALAAGAGIAGSILRASAQRQRTGSAKGSGLGLNLALDALGAIPGIGLVAKAGKVAKGAKSAKTVAKAVSKAASKAASKSGKVSKFTQTSNWISDAADWVKASDSLGAKAARKASSAISYGLPAMGLASGVSAAIEAANSDEPMNTEQFQRILMGATTAPLLGRKAVADFGKKRLKSIVKQTVKGKKPEYKLTGLKKNGKTETVTLSSDQVKKVLDKKTVKEANEYLEKLLKDYDKDSFDASTLLEDFGFKQKGVWRWKKPQAVSSEKVSIQDALANENIVKRLSDPNSWSDKQAAAAWREQLQLKSNSDKLSKVSDILAKLNKRNGSKYDVVTVPEANAWGFGTKWVRTSKPTKRRTSTRRTATPAAPAAPATPAAPAAPATPAAPVPETLTRRRFVGPFPPSTGSRYGTNANNKLRADLRKYLTTGQRGDLLLFIEQINKNKFYRNAYLSDKQLRKDLFSRLINADGTVNATGKTIGQWAAKKGYAFKQGGKILKGQAGLTPGNLIHSNQSPPTFFDYQKSGIIFDPNNNVDWGSTYNDGSTFMNYRQQYIDNWDKPEFAIIRQAYLDQLGSNNTDRLNGLNINDLSLDEFERITSDQKLGYGHNLWIPAFAEFQNNNTGNTNPNDGNDGVNPDDANPNEGTPNTGNENAPFNIGGQTVGNWTIGNPNNQTKRPIDWDYWIGSHTALANSVIGNNRAYRARKKGIDALYGTLEQMPTEIYDRYQDHITPIYEEAAKQYYQFTPTSTDSRLNYAQRQSNASNAINLLTEGRLKESEQYSNFLAQDLAARRQYADERRRVDQANREKLATIAEMHANNNVARITTNYQSLDNYIQDFRNRYNQDTQRQWDFKRDEDMYRADDAKRVAMDNYLVQNGLYAEYEALPATEKQKYGSIDNWLITTKPSTYYERLQAGEKAYTDSIRSSPQQYLFYHSMPRQSTSSTATPHTLYGSYKQGGKLTASEQIWVQKNRATLEALEKLNENIIKLFMSIVT